MICHVHESRIPDALTQEENLAGLAAISRDLIAKAGIAE